MGNILYRAGLSGGSLLATVFLFRVLILKKTFNFHFNMYKSSVLFLAYLFKLTSLFILCHLLLYLYFYKINILHFVFMFSFYLILFFQFYIYSYFLLLIIIYFILILFLFFTYISFQFYLYFGFYPPFTCYVKTVMSMQNCFLIFLSNATGMTFIEVSCTNCLFGFSTE